MTTPYAHASGKNARDEICKILRNFGCENVGFMDNFAENSILLAFRHRGRNVQLQASAKGWAKMYIRENPWTSRKRVSRQEYEDRAMVQGMSAINSILRDWVKGQVTAIETGVLSFDDVFLPYMLTSDGRPLVEHIAAQGLLPEPKDDRT
jgi:hypothetical protein